MAEQTASQEAMTTQQVTIKLRAPDLNPPVYIAGSFTEEPWSPVKMDVMEVVWENGKMLTTAYYKTFNLEPGEYQYKFRLGDGDWWIYDENNEIVKDDSGNSNNLLVVLPIDDVKESGIAVDESAVDPSKVKIIENLLPKIASPQLQASSEHGSVVEEEIPCPPYEMALGTWQPDQEVSPMYRRASTSLGVRISRMGTFIPPDDDEVEEQDHYDDIARFDGSSIDHFGHSGPPCIAYGAYYRMPTTRGRGHHVHLSNLDSILEVPQVTEGYLTLTRNRQAPGALNGAMTTTYPIHRTSGKYMPDINGRKVSPVLAPFVKATKPKTQSTDYSHWSGPISQWAESVIYKEDGLLAAPTAWVQGIWTRLSGGLKEEGDGADDGDHN